MNTRKIIQALEYGMSKGESNSTLFAEGRDQALWNERKNLYFYKEMLKDVYTLDFEAIKPKTSFISEITFITQ